MEVNGDCCVLGCWRRVHIRASNVHDIGSLFVTHGHRKEKEKEVGLNIDTIYIALPCLDGRVVSRASLIFCAGGDIQLARETNYGPGI